jgi:hypothetical protein
MLALVLVYRDASRTLSRFELRRELAVRLADCPAHPGAFPPGEQPALLALLMVSAELEAALEDLGDGAPASSRAGVRRFTDACAEAWWNGASWDTTRLARELDALPFPERVELKRAEGYAYYALDPGAYARSAAARAPLDGRVLVIGIRSIGTSLGAVVRAGLRARGVDAERLGVRPTGHAWDREYTPSHTELDTIREHRQAECFVVDEGPGLSGSTFLAVGEGLERAGVARERITFFTSHAVDVQRLVARDAARRWARFRSVVVPEPMPFEGAIDLGGGCWRAHVYASDAEWPGCWTSAERRKFRVPESLDLLKFVGLGHYAEAPLERAERLAQAGFAPAVSALHSGYLRQRWCSGEVLRRPAEGRWSAGSGGVRRLCEYLAFRREACTAPEGRMQRLEEMTRVNVAEALGIELPLAFQLDVERWVYPDARLMPHEWVAPIDGRLVKVDAVDHGDDHFFPGPCDGAWDLAGAILELELSPLEALDFLADYQRLTGDDASARIPCYQVAYLACRVGALSMAASSADALERPRLERDLAWYATRLRRSLNELRW